jgi:hypothetical protein
LEQENLKWRLRGNWCDNHACDYKGRGPKTCYAQTGTPDWSINRQHHVWVPFAPIIKEAESKYDTLAHVFDLSTFRETFDDSCQDLSAYDYETHSHFLENQENAPINVPTLSVPTRPSNAPTVHVDEETNPLGRCEAYKP